MNNTFERGVYVLAALASTALVAASWFGLAPLGLTEVFGFISGGVTVWLTVKQNIWTWPIGIVNNIFFIVLFWEARLYADMGLQVVYIILSLLGWYWWLYGGAQKTVLTVSRAPVTAVVTLVVLGAIATFGMERYLTSVGDSAPFWDALTTVMSLCAQYLLTKKYIENWFVWMAADIIYIALYAFKDLYLTALLYAIFFAMCIAGYRAWHASRQVALTPVTSPSL